MKRFYVKIWSMFTNGRSVYQVQTSDRRRARLWDRIFGTDTLPVLHNAPRYQEWQGRGYPVLAYDLDVSRLSDMQRARFAGHLSRIEKRPYSMVIKELNSGMTFPIQASEDIKVIEPAKHWSLLASLLHGKKRPFFEPVFS